MNQPDDAWSAEELKREIKIRVDQADRGEFVEFTAEAIIRTERETLARQKSSTQLRGGPVAEPESSMRGLLLERGFSFDRPDVRCAWEAFKVFATIPMAGLPPYCVGYECEHVSDRDDVLWLSFARRSHPELAGYDQGLGYAADFGCGFSCVVPQHLWGTHESRWWWPECEFFSKWASHVENMHAFKACMDLKNWRWEGFSL